MRPSLLEEIGTEHVCLIEWLGTAETRRDFSHLVKLDLCQQRSHKGYGHAEGQSYRSQERFSDETSTGIKLELSVFICLATNWGPWQSYEKLHLGN